MTAAYLSLEDGPCARAIQGKGLFAKAAIAKGEIVAVKGGHVLTGPEWRR